MRMKFNFGRSYKKTFLEQAFLRLAFVAFLFFFGLFYLFHQVTMAVTVHPGFVAVLTQIIGNIFLVDAETCINEKPAKISRNYRHKQKKGNQAPKHYCSKGKWRNLNIQVIRIKYIWLDVNSIKFILLKNDQQIIHRHPGI